MFIHMYIFVGLGSWTYACCIFIFASYVLLVAMHSLPSAYTKEPHSLEALRSLVHSCERERRCWLFLPHNQGVQMKHLHFRAFQTEGTSPQWHCCPRALPVHANLIIMRGPVHAHPLPPKHARLVTNCNFRTISFSVGKVRSKNEPAQPFQLFF